MDKKMNDLILNKPAIIVKVHHPDEKMQRRLYDLGFYEGTAVMKSLQGPQGDPAAYKIKGATIALRNQDAQYIHVRGLD